MKRKINFAICVLLTSLFMQCKKERLVKTPEIISVQQGVTYNEFNQTYQFNTQKDFIQLNNQITDLINQCEDFQEVQNLLDRYEDRFNHHSLRKEIILKNQAHLSSGGIVEDLPGNNFIADFATQVLLNKWGEISIGDSVYFSLDNYRTLVLPTNNNQAVSRIRSAIKSGSDPNLTLGTLIDSREGSRDNCCHKNFDRTVSISFQGGIIESKTYVNSSILGFGKSRFGITNTYYKNGQTCPLDTIGAGYWGVVLRHCKKPTYFVGDEFNYVNFLVNSPFCFRSQDVVDPISEKKVSYGVEGGLSAVVYASTHSQYLKYKYAYYDPSKTPCSKLPTEIDTGSFSTPPLQIDTSGSFYLASECDPNYNPMNLSGFNMAHSGYGDFDGNGKTDVLFTSGHEWLIAYDGSLPWQSVQSSTLDVKDLRFGDFDGDGGTDVLFIDGDHFKVHYNATSPLNDVGYSGNLNLDHNVAVGHFNQNNYADIFISLAGEWKIFEPQTGQTTSLGYQGLDMQEVLLADLNGDELTDVLRVRNDFGTQICEVLYTGTNIWMNKFSSASLELEDLVIVDKNGDKESDIIDLGNNTIHFSGAFISQIFTLSPFNTTLDLDQRRMDGWLRNGAEKRFIFMDFNGDKKSDFIKKI